VTFLRTRKKKKGEGKGAGPSNGESPEKKEKKESVLDFKEVSVKRGEGGRDYFK